MPIKYIHDTCTWPPKQPCLPQRPGVKCAPIQEEYLLECNLPQKPDFAVAHKEPIVVEWPPKQEMGQGDCEPDTGIREDLLAKIPDQIVPQVVTVPGIPIPQPGPYGQDVPPMIQHAKLQHPICPDGQLHVAITPPQPVKTEYRIPPELPAAVRQPMRPWRQCIENTLINDRVRRPMARWCHKRPLPGLVIPTCEFQRMRDKVTEPERKAKEKADRIAWRECQRLNSRQRMAKWNYTVESLLDRKKAKEEAKEQAERDSFAQLLKTIKENRDNYSEEQIARAKKLMLYRKGLIRDFHSALAFSKMQQDIQRSRENNDKDKMDAPNTPVCEQKCMKRMLYEINKPDLDQMVERKPKKINEKLEATLQNIETRQKEQKVEIDNAISKIKEIAKDALPELPPSYLKSIAEPECREDVNKFCERRKQFYEELDEKLAIDAFIESHEKEVERQACEYAKFKQHKDLIRKQTEQRLIEEKVKRNIEKSEKAAAALVAARQKKQKENGFDYDALKEKWEEEIQEREEDRKARHERLRELVEKDFLERKGHERCKWQMRDVSRLWARERLVAVENYEQECERKNIRRQEAEEIQLYNQAAASEKRCQAEREKMYDNAWAEKIKGQYFEEMQEMKDYAQECIRDWAGKGRSPIPMYMAMKKWEYDSQMDPRMFRQYEEKKKCLKGEEEASPDGYALLISAETRPYKCKSTVEECETTQTTAKRLGFC